MPSVFQHALDDILHEHIGKICYIYINDVIIFHKDSKSHTNFFFKTLQNVSIKCQLNTCEFFKTQVEFLGFVISDKGIKTNPNKVLAIAKISSTKVIKELRAFLDLASYYWRFNKDFAKMAKPLSSLLGGEDGRVSKRVSAKEFDKLKFALVSEKVILHRGIV